MGERALSVSSQAVTLGLGAVVFSNHAHAVIQAKCRMLGAAAFFDKSFQMDELLNLIEGEAGAHALALA